MGQECHFTDLDPKKGGRGCKNFRNERWKMLTHNDESFNNVATNTLMFFHLTAYLQRQMALNCSPIAVLMTQKFSQPKAIGIGVVLLSCNKICII